MLTMNDVIREGHPTLETVAKPVELPLDDETKNTLKEMRQFLLNSQDETIREKYELREGVGLAAPQIDISKRMLAIHTLDEKFETLHDYVMINPKIVSHSVQETYLPGGEGCLSIDREVEGLVPRKKKVTVDTYLFNTETEEVTRKELRLRGFLAVVFQHELDHLDGILFPKRIKESLPDASPVEFQTPEDASEDEEKVEEKL
ncbi:MAG: peptide deformylase [Bacillota bacterium]